MVSALACTAPRPYKCGHGAPPGVESSHNPTTLAHSSQPPTHCTKCFEHLCSDFAFGYAAAGV